MRGSGGTAHPGRRQHPDDVALRAGVLATVVLGAVYPFGADDLGHPLGAFVLPTLVAASIGGPRPALVAGGFALGVALVLGLADVDLDGGALLAQLVIVAMGVAVGTALAAARRRNEERLDDVVSTAALLAAFQNGLLPVGRTSTDISCDTRYVPGEDRMSLGGDFIDLVHVTDDACAFVLGDVSGHGPEAAAFGAAVRAGWRSLAVSRPGEPVAWLELLERAFFADRRFDGFVTALTGWIEPASRSITLASAGHCWPVIVGDRRARLVEVGGGVPLGVTANGVWTTATLTLGADERLLVHTDGLIENRRGAAGRGCGEDGLVAWLSAHADSDGIDLDLLLDQLGPDGFDDDVAVLSIGVNPRDPVRGPRPH